jgi:LPXTG-site transpeptidase (sortase) family protein
MTRYHYREGVTLDKKKSRWFLFLIAAIVFAAAAYVVAVYLAPQLVTVPFTSLTTDATDHKIQNSKAGQFGDRLFIPQINVDVAVSAGGDKSQLESGAWQRNTALGDPDKGGNVVLSGHKFMLDMTPQWTRTKSPFYNLDKLKTGDDLTLDYKGKRYVYKVDRTFDVTAGASDIEQKADGYRLTLYATDNSGAAVAGTGVSAKRISPVTDQQANADFGGKE